MQVRRLVCDLRIRNLHCSATDIEQQHGTKKRNRHDGSKNKRYIYIYIYIERERERES